MIGVPCAEISNVSSVKSDVVSLRRMPLCNRVSNSVEVTFPCLHHPPPSPPPVLKSADGRAGDIGLCANQSILVVETCGTFDFPGSAGGSLETAEGCRFCGFSN